MATERTRVIELCELVVGIRHIVGLQLITGLSSRIPVRRLAHVVRFHQRWEPWQRRMLTSAVAISARDSILYNKVGKSSTNG